MSKQTEFDKELEVHLRNAAVWAWEQGKKQKDTPYDLFTC